METKCIPLVLIGMLLDLLLPTQVSAGVVPLSPAGKRLNLPAQAALTAERDVIVYRLLADRVEAEQRLVVSAGDRPGKFWLGLPLPEAKRAGPQGVTVGTLVGGKRAKVKLSRKRAGKKVPVGVAAFKAFRVKLGAGQQAEITVTWWQPLAEVEVHGYWRIALSDPLWTAGAFRGQVGKLERRVELSQGVRWMSSAPDAEVAGDEGVAYEARPRVLALNNSSPEPGQVFLIKVKRSAGAVSECGGDVWLAVDGDPATRWEPEACPAGQAWLDLVSDCTGFGSASPVCERLRPPGWVHGLSVRTADGKGRAKVIVEGYLGRRRVWSKAGRLNEPVSVRKTKAVSRFRVRLPGGPPAGGVEVTLLRVDPAEATRGFAQVLGGRGFGKMGKRCVVELPLVNPAPLRHATFVLKPGSKVDTYLLNMDCTDGRKRVPFHEPVQCNHTPEEHRQMGVEPEALETGHTQDHYKRKQPNRIQLPLDPTCSAKILRIIAPPTLCTERFRAPIPRIELVY